MIDPFKITDYNRTQDELEEFLLFTICVAGKKATMIASKLESLLNLGVGTPFEIISDMIRNETLEPNLKKVNMGKYGLLSKAFKLVVSSSFDLRNVKPNELEIIPGIGKKTSRFFILHSQKNAEVAVIDTHILKFLNSKNYNAGKTIPTGKKYNELEKIMLKEAKKANMNPADFDLKIWSHYASGNRDPLYF